MNDIKQSIKLYNMMSDRFKKSGKAPYQTSIYSEIAEFMSDCSTAEEAAVKIRKSKYYLAPSVALIKDKLTVLRDMANEIGLSDLVTVYDQKLDEINEDPQEIYETGYERTAQNIKVKYSETVEAFCHIYQVYAILSCEISGDDEEKQSYLREIQESLSKLSTPDSSFLNLAGNPKFRELIPASDQGYDKFVMAINDLSAFDFAHGDETDCIDSESEAAWEDIKNAKNMIKKSGETYLENIRKSRVMVVSPQNKDGSYEYIDEVVKSHG